MRLIPYGCLAMPRTSFVAMQVHLHCQCSLIATRPLCSFRYIIEKANCHDDSYWHKKVFCEQFNLSGFSCCQRKMFVPPLLPRSDAQNNFRLRLIYFQPPPAPHRVPTKPVQFSLSLSREMIWTISNWQQLPLMLGRMKLAPYLNNSGTKVVVHY
jgi:hypothetical protein